MVLYVFVGSCFFKSIEFMGSDSVIWTIEYDFLNVQKSTLLTVHVCAWVYSCILKLSITIYVLMCGVSVNINNGRQK